MSCPSIVERIEEFAGEIGASAADLAEFSAVYHQKALIFFEARPATDDEKLNIDSEAESLPEGVRVVDFGEYGVLANLPDGEHVVTSRGIAPLSDGTFVVQVTQFGDGAFIKRI